MVTASAASSSSSAARVSDRLSIELLLLREAWPNLTYEPVGQWVMLPDYPVPEGWSRTLVTTAFQVPTGPPGTPPYAFYVDSPMMFRDQAPANCSPAAGGVPFPGQWSTFSWAPEAWAWTEDPAKGANMRSFARSFADRFLEGA